MAQNKIFDYYILIHKPSHPRAMGQGYVPEHVLVAEKQLGRFLTPDEDVRHINGNTHDNRPTNLEIISTHSDYRSISLSDPDYSNRKPVGTFMPCKFQKPCWKEVRAPLARRTKKYLPYTCSYQTEGDIYKCSRFWGYLEKEMENMKIGESHRGSND